MAINPFDDEVIDTPGISPVTGETSGGFTGPLPSGIDPTTGAVDFSPPEVKKSPPPRQNPFANMRFTDSVLRGGKDDQRAEFGELERTPENNYGYLDKNLAVSLLGSMKGPFGLAGKALNLAINANNVAAVNTARKAMGLAPLSKKETIQGLVKDQKGYLGDVVVGDKQYAVSLEAMTPEGRTALTPDEARRRAAVTGGIRLATEEEVAKAKEQARLNPDIGRKGFLTAPLEAGVQAVQNTIDRVTGREKPEFTGGPVPATVAPEFDPTPQRPTVTSESIVPSTVERSVLSPVSPVDRLSPVNPSVTPSVEQREITPGAGLRNVADVTNSQFNPTGRGRPAPADADLSIAIDMAVKDALGPGFGIQATSGTYDPETQARIDATMAELEAAGINPNSPRGKAALQAVGQVGTTRHSQGKALDFAVVDEEGNLVTDPAAMEAVAESLGINGISSLGYGEGYMGAGVMHADVHRDRAPTWGGNRKVAQSFLENRNEVGILPKVNPPTPTFRPSLVAEEEVTNQTVDARAPEILDAVSYTIAGELGSKTLSGIASGDPEAIETARQEIAAIASTIDNRARSTRFAEIADPRERYAEVLSPSQYNSLMEENIDVTEENYAQFGDFIKETIADYDAGKIASPVPDATHYRASYLEAPSWENTVGVPVGEHVFSTSVLPGTDIPEYRPAETRTGFMSAPETSSLMDTQARMSSLSPTAGFGTLGTPSSALSTPAPARDPVAEAVEQAQEESTTDTSSETDSSTSADSNDSGGDSGSRTGSGPSGTSGPSDGSSDNNSGRSSSSSDDDDSSSGPSGGF